MENKQKKENGIHQCKILYFNPLGCNYSCMAFGLMHIPAFHIQRLKFLPSIVFKNFLYLLPYIFLKRYSFSPIHLPIPCCRKAFPQPDSARMGTLCSNNFKFYLTDDILQMSQKKKLFLLSRENLCPNICFSFSLW